MDPVLCNPIHIAEVRFQGGQVDSVEITLAGGVRTVVVYGDTVRGSLALGLTGGQVGHLGVRSAVEGVGVEQWREFIATWKTILQIRIFL